MTLASPLHLSNTDRSGTPLTRVTAGRCPVLPLPPAQGSASPASFLFAHPLVPISPTCADHTAPFAQGSRRHRGAASQTLR